MQRDFTTPETEQTSFFVPAKKAPHFAGPDYIAKLDQKRLTGQHERIKNLMLDGRWRTLPEIAEACRAGESSVSAQLRHLRKPEFGGYTLHRQRRTLGGLNEYKVTI